jgi:2-octaprenyl-6-methoxyphenol hydroxylase
MKNQADVIIIGAGLVGAAQAVALAQAGLHVALIEAAPRSERLNVAGDGRVSAIALASVRVLESIGVWQRLEDTCAITDIRVCEDGGSYFVHYDSSEVEGGEAFGHMVANTQLRPALTAACDELESITQYEGVTVAQLKQDANKVEVTLSDGTEISAALLLAADGRFSKTREALGIGVKVYEYGQTAMVMTIKHEKPHHGLAVENFFPAGPFAILPMSHNRSNIVWSEPDDMAAWLMQQDDALILEELRKRTGDHLGEYVPEGKRHSYPLKLIKADRMVEGRAALVGDAGHGIHPIAGQGVNLGYRDVAVLTEVLLEQARLGLDIGAPEVLKRYAALRKPDIESMCAATDMLNRLFSNPNPLLKFARDRGLGLVERIAPAKQFFMLQAMGLGGRHTPAMMKGKAA